uniref:Uncharacterized protein n=1 Tax=viral metagenome TaxID=1070528 RepID=A0A6H1ZMM8_9ZZZZ
MDIKIPKRIAKNLSAKQLLDANILYHSFMKEISSQYEIHRAKPNEDFRDVLAHNLAIIAVWELDGDAI